MIEKARLLEIYQQASKKKHEVCPKDIDCDECCYSNTICELELQAKTALEAFDEYQKRCNVILKLETKIEI